MAVMVRDNPGITEIEIQQLRTYFQLDQPITTRYLMWIWNLIHLNFGFSYSRNAPVESIIWPYFLQTLKLQMTAIAFTVPLSIYLGVKSARKQNSISDIGVRIFSIVGLSIPIFVLGTILILMFSFYLPIFPYGDAYSTLSSPLFGNPFLDSLWHLVLPTITLSLSYFAVYVGLTRSNMLEVIRLDYILSAKASGLPEKTIYYRHALKNAILPVVTQTGVWIGQGVASAPVTETIFNWPGLGYLFVRALDDFDAPLVMAIALVLSVMVIVSTMVVDALYAALDPRLRK